MSPFRFFKINSNLALHDQMNRRKSGRRFAAVQTIVFLLLATATFAQQPQQLTPAKSPANVGFAPERLARLDALLQGFVDQGIAPNAVTFVARRGQVIHHKAFGYSNLEKRTPLKTDDLFRIASQTKALTTAALLMLLEEGKFLAEDPISKYIPAFKNPKVLTTHNAETGQYETRPAKSEITIHHLLTHTAGIPYEHPLQNDPKFRVPFFNSLEADRLEDVVNRIAARPLVADPGEKFVYGLNTDVLSRLIEVLAGQPLDQFLKTRLLDPLGMTDTHFYLPAAKAGRLVELYSKPTTTAKLSLHENAAYRTYPVTGAKTYFSGGAGLISTVGDYAKFCQFLLNGGRFNGQQLLSPKTVALMARNQTGSLEVWDRGDGFSYGLQVFGERSRYAGNASIGALSWGGMYCSEYTIDPKEDLILLVFTNVQPYAHYSEFVRKFRNVVYQALVD
jgi:CubicO group peptidase (beta-lactamase class C family)